MHFTFLDDRALDLEVRGRPLRIYGLTNWPEAPSLGVPCVEYTS